MATLTPDVPVEERMPGAAFCYWTPGQALVYATIAGYTCRQSDLYETDLDRGFYAFRHEDHWPHVWVLRRIGSTYRWRRA